MNLQNKTIVVTGVASGIGAEVARLARFHGATVIGVDRTPVQMSLHGFHQADLGDPASIDALVQALPARVDALANVAGVPGTAPLEVVARVNYLGLRHLSQALLPRMTPGGSIINVASILGAEWRSAWNCTSNWPPPTALRLAMHGCRRIRWRTTPATSTSRKR